ncbi:alpha/beta hydrolase fold domain-containing protein [Brevundimonas sp. BAL450]|uniref:alpha/beta hydrolase n=1 Tax=Brevundimonas TaxID=41275 RepID=UPI0005EC3BB2|nr:MULTISPECIES: alpha/beta hydrolase fold domain-containing protein [Brevundimonas]MBG7614776.1 alpha/beta hydrolase fold domain-containing protein [Brevundimonas sp. BAL450]
MVRTLKVLFLVAVVAAAAPAVAQQAPMTAMDAPAEPNALPLDTGGVEGSEAPESWFSQWGDTFVRNVTVATLTPVLPEPGTANGAAVILAPGGGFMFLSMSNEGWEVAQALADQGVAAFVLKYRVRPTPADLGEFEQSVTAMFAGAGPRPARPGGFSLADPVEDATAAFALVRSRADEWGVDPDRIGMVGFSAGAGTTLATTLTAPETRPAFIAPIYGAMTAVEVPETAPPMFVVLAADDPLFANSGFGLVESWRTAGRPVEFHLYQNGGHGFGLGNPGMTSLGWFDGFMRWLELNGFLQAGP